MDLRPPRIKGSLAEAVRQAFRRAGATFSPRRRRFLRESHLFEYPVQPGWNASSIGQALVSAIARVTGAEDVLLFLRDVEQGEMVVAVSEGANMQDSIHLQLDSPVLAWLGKQRKAVRADEIRSLPQLQGLPPAEMEFFLGPEGGLFISVPGTSMSRGLLVVGRREDGTAYAQEELEGIEMLVSRASAGMEIAWLREQLDGGQRALQRARGQLAGLASQAKIGEAVSAHVQELQGSLRAVLSLLEAMRREASEGGVSRQALDMLETEMTHVRESLLPILEMAHEEQWDWDVHALNSLVLSAVAASGLGAAGSRIQIVLHLDPGEPRVRCDESRLKQVFGNLISNALDAMPRKGALTISTRGVGDRVEVRFADTGAGISAEHLERVLDPFFTTKAEGSGMGLASSRRTVERHRGSISVESVVGKGTTVTVVLPVSLTP